MCVGFDAASLGTNKPAFGSTSEATSERKVLQFAGAFANMRKATVSFAMSVSPHGTARLPLDGFS